MAEGQTEAAEGQEPYSLKQTMTFKALTVQEDNTHNPAAETGLIAAIKPEGLEDGNAQDASLTNDEVQSAPQAEPTPTPPIKSPLVLIVEDNAELGEVLQVTLERMNLQTVHETHGAKALTRVVELDPDVLLLDIGLPDTSGWKIMDVIKERWEKENARRPTVIIITALDDPANRLIGKLQGVDNYLIKPFTSNEIEQVVTQALSTRTS